MKIIETKQSLGLLNGQIVNVNKPAYLYELLNDGAVAQRHSMILNTLTNDLIAKGYNLEAAVQLDGLSFHNLCLSAFGPYMTNSNGEQVYSFRADHTLVKLDPGMKHPDSHFHVILPNNVYKCVSMESSGGVRSIDYLVIMKNGAIRFTYRYTPTVYRMTVLSNIEMPDNVKNHILNKGGQQFADKESADVKSTNNPAIGFKLLLDLLNEEETNGDTVNHKN